MTKQLKADLLLLLVTAIWGASFTLMKNVLEKMPAFAYLSFRFLLASLILLIVLRKSLCHINRKTILYGALIGLMLFGGMALQVSGLYYTTASNSAFITGLSVVMVPAITAIFMKRKPDAASIMGVTLAFGGLFFLSGGLRFHFNFGDLLTLFCAGCFALQIIFIDRFTENQSPELLAVFQITFAAILFSGVWLVVDYKPIVFNITIITTLLITGVLGTAVAFSIQTVVQRFTSPTHTVLIFTAEPVFGALFAVLIPNSKGITESLSYNSIIGCMLILIGMLFAEFKFSWCKKGTYF